MKPGTVFRIAFTGVALVLGVSMVLTTMTSVHAADCTTDVKTDAADVKTTGQPGLAAATAPLYLEIQSGDVQLNRRLRERLEAQLPQKLPQMKLVDRAARHAPKNALGLRVTVRSWAPKWTPLWARAISSVEAEVRFDDGKGTNAGAVKGDLTTVCTGIVNQTGFFDTDTDRIVAWALEQWAVESRVRP